MSLWGRNFKFKKIVIYYGYTLWPSVFGSTGQDGLFY
jgi:hypothetical protein